MAIVVPAAQAAAQPQQPAGADAVLYRIFLRDGGMLVSFGEFAHVGDRIVVSIPIGGSDAAPVLHVLTIAERDIDWERTNAYAHTARARRYADTRGEADFAAVSRDVANLLNRIAFVDDPARRLALGEAARRQLVEWPQQHYGYRADEIWQMATWLDQVVSDLRIGAGQSSFDLSLVAPTTVPAPAVQLLPPPTERERVELGLAAARRSTDAAERRSLLRGVMDLLRARGSEASWAAALRARAATDLAIEVRTDRAYTRLTNRTLEKAEPYVRRADVRGLEDLVRVVLAEDGRLNHARPGEVAALLATLDARIDGARRLRLARDAWVLQSAAIREYRRNVREGLDRLLGLRMWLVDVRQLAGPSPRSVQRLADHAALAGRGLARVQPPAVVASTHGTLLAASALASRAASLRLEALRDGNVETAWQASSAAAGSLMLLDQALSELRRLGREPLR